MQTVHMPDGALLLDERDALRARVAEVEAAQRWIPVTERLPETGVYILARDADARLDIVCLDSAGHWWRSIRPLRDVTHWRTLPAGPEVQP